jgi:endonuclease YncB( thermonuclease family)
MRRRTILMITALTIVAAACTSTRPLPPEFIETTTSTTTILLGEPGTTTTLTLPPVEDREVGTVTEVTDGDTLSMLLDGQEVVVRLDGINAPELDECWGPEAAALLTTRLVDQQLVLVEGETNVDQFGRLLRYAYLETDKGAEFINATLVAEGNALAVQNGGPSQSDLKTLEARAYQSGKGMWGSLVCGDEEAIRADRPVVRVGEIQFDPPGPDDDALGDEYVTFVNEGYGRVSFSGWVLRDESSSNRLTFPNNTVLAPGDSVTVVTGCDGGPPESIKWCSDTPVWSNGGDTVIVSDTLGNAVIWFTYAGE